MILWLLAAPIVAQDYYVTFGAPDNANCTDINGCNLRTFKQLHAKIGDHVHLNDEQVTKPQFLDVINVMRDDFTITGAPTTIVETGKSSTVSDEYLLSIKSMEIAFNALNFSALRNPILRAVNSKVTLTECTMNSTRSMNSPTIQITNSHCEFVGFVFHNNSHKHTEFFNIIDSKVVFVNASFCDNFHLGTKDWSFIQCWNSEMHIDGCMLAQMSVTHYALVAYHMSNVTIIDWYVEEFNGTSFFGAMDQSSLEIDGCILDTVDCSLVRAVNSTVSLITFAAERLGRHKQVFSMVNSSLCATDMQFRQGTLSTLIHAEGKQTIEMHNTSVVSCTTHSGLVNIAGGDLVVTNAIFMNVQSPDVCSMCRVLDGSITAVNTSLVAMNLIAATPPMMWLTNAVATMDDVVMSDGSGSALWCEFSSYNLTRCRFSSITCMSSAESGLAHGMVFTYHNKQSRIQDCKFEMCRASGSCISVAFCSIDIQNCVFEECSGYRGVVLVTDRAVTNVYNCTFLDNHAVSVGIIYQIAGALNMTSCHFNGNTAAVAGSGLYCTGKFQLTMTNVSTGNNQTSLISSPLKFARFSMRDCNLSHTLAEAIEVESQRAQMDNCYFECMDECRPGSAPDVPFRGLMTRQQRLAAAKNDLEECLIANGWYFSRDVYTANLARLEAVFTDEKRWIPLSGLYDHLVADSAARIIVPKAGFIILVPLCVVILFAHVFIKEKTE